MDSPFATVGLPAALAVIMFGLGLTLTVTDFLRIARTPRAMAVALFCQLVALPLVAFGLALLFGLPPLLAVGLMLLAASPGGTTANLFSHLFGGDVALNISLTAINSIIAVVTVPVVTNFALNYFTPGEQGEVGLQFSKVVQVFAVVLVPVVVGMIARRLSSRFAAFMDRPVRIASVVLLVLVVIATVVAERDNVASLLADAGLVTLAFCVISLTLGYVVPRLAGIDIRQAIASSMEIGIHNSMVALTIAIGILGSTEIAVPAAVYGVLMYPVAAAFGWIAFRGKGRAAAAEEARLRELQPAPSAG